MRLRSFLAFVLAALAATAVLARGEHAPSASPAQCVPGAPPASFLASTEKPFGQLMDDAMGAMHRDMHAAPSSGDPDRDFVTMMIPHHLGAIDMAEAVLLYGHDVQVRRLAQEIVADQQNEVQLMQLWLVKHPATTKGEPHVTPATQREGRR